MIAMSFTNGEHSGYQIGDTAMDFSLKNVKSKMKVRAKAKKFPFEYLYDSIQEIAKTCVNDMLKSLSHYQINPRHFFSLFHPH